MPRRKAESAAKPDIVGGIPADRHILRKCQMILAGGDSWAFPEETARELARWIIDNAKLPRLSGVEIAAMVDYRASRGMSIGQAAEDVSDLLCDVRTVDSILKAQQRNSGRTAKSLEAESRDRRISHEAMVEADAEMSVDERQELETILTSNRRKIERLQQAWLEYLAAKKDIFG